MAERPRLAVWKFSSCDGCQLQLLDCEDELLALAGRVEISYFPEASSAVPLHGVAHGHFDLSLVEGSIASPADVERIRRVRRMSRRLVTIGAECKARGTTCVLVARATPCLRPVTQAGCGAICPAYGRGCYGCFRPAESASTAALGAAWDRLGARAGDLTRALRGVNAWAPAFREGGGDDGR